MPPRWLTALIVAFWLGTTGWLVYREVADRVHSGEPPRFAIDLTDEVSANTIAWNVLQKGERVGMGRSWVRRRPDRTFELRSEFRFHEFSVLNVLKFRKMTSMYRVDADGHFQALAAEVYFENNPVFDMLEVAGELRDGFVTPRVKCHSGRNVIDMPFKKFKVPERGSVLNPMHLVNKIHDLYDGQTWHIPLLDPFGAQFPGQSMHELKAEVSRDRLVWQNQATPCFRIDYREPGKKVTARTWVRSNDGLVLQQEAAHEGQEIILQREKLPESK
ncbi:MAG: hypothetical protein FJ271_30685 [Planctomycetes bacterium]|nr:hypothetical protein [Planctomycetota bacterium]